MFINGTGSNKSSIVVTSSGIFTVEVSNGCNNEVFKFLVDEKECNCEIVAPNVFTPNGDGTNETMVISGTSDIARYNLRIFNRWGKQVYETDNIGNYWNGNLNGKEVPSGAYYWAVDIQCIQGNLILDNFYKGWITLLR